MELYPVYPHERHPAVQLLFLGLLAILGLLLFAGLGIAMVYLLYGQAGFNAVLSQDVQNTANMPALRVLIIAQQLGLFGAPALLLAVTEQRRPSQFYPMDKPRGKWLLMVFWLLLFAIPFIGYVNEMNQKMQLPAALKAAEDWMRALEDQNKMLTEALLATPSWSGLLANLFTIAVVPAICEELLFRGGLQRGLARWVTPPHVAIWATAVIFSVIHFQFFGFFTRLFLGAGLGYIYYFTKSIWYSIFVHFLNNAYAVIAAFYFARKNLPLEQANGPNIGWMGALTSLLLTLVLFKLLERSGRRLNQNHELYPKQGATSKF